MEEYICPNCKQPIFDDDALLCHFCGGSLKRGGSGFIGNLKYGQKGALFIVICVIIVLSFILLFVR